MNQFTEPIADRLQQSTSSFWFYLVSNVKCCGEAESDPDLDNLSAEKLNVIWVRSQFSGLSMQSLNVISGGTVLG